MALQVSKPHIRLSVNFHEHPQIIRLRPETAALRLIYMIAWSKRQDQDGKFTVDAFNHEGGNDEELQVLLSQKLIAAETEEGWYCIVDYDKWQVTTSEIEDAQRRGSRGGSNSTSKHTAVSEISPEVKVVRAGALARQDASFDVEASFDLAYDIYPKRPGDTRAKAFAAYSKKVTDVESRDEILDGIRGYAHAWSSWSEDVRAKVHYFADFVTRDELWSKWRGAAPPLPPPTSYEPVELSLDIPVFSPEPS